MTIPDFDELLLGLASALEKGQQKDCFSEEVLQNCEQAKSGELRGRKLKHVAAKQHLDSIKDTFETHITEINKKKELREKVLAAKDQLPPFYLVPKKSNSESYEFIETSKYLENLTSKVSSNVARIATLKALNELMGGILQKASHLQAELIKLNEGVASDDDITAIKKGVYAEYEAAKNTLNEKVNEIQRSRKLEFLQKLKADMVDNDYYIPGFYLFSMSSLTPRTPESIGSMKAVHFAKAALDAVSNYDKVFASCLKGIEANAAEQKAAKHESSSSNAGSDDSSSDIDHSHTDSDDSTSDADL